MEAGRPDLLEVVVIRGNRTSRGEGSGSGSRGQGGVEERIRGGIGGDNGQDLMTGGIM